MPDDRLSIKEAARLLKVGVSTIYRWVLTQKIPALRIGGRVWVRKADILAVPQQVPAATQGQTTGFPSHEEAVRELRRKGYMTA